MNRSFSLVAFCLILLASSNSKPLRGQTAGAIVPVTLSNTLAANDDDSTDAVPLNIGGSAGINFFGQSFKQVYVNNNGNLTFTDSLSDYTPNGLAQGLGLPIIAGFFADVDTSGTGSGLVQYGNAAVDGFNAFVANYINVGYFDSNVDKLNSFQIVLVDRADTGAGNFDIEFNYNQILWETGDADDGTDGLGGTSAVAGYSNGLSGSRNVYFQLPGSLVNGALIDGGPNALVSHSLNSGVPGRYIFPVRNGVVTLLLSNVACLPRTLGQSGVSTCTVNLTGPAPAGGSSVTLSSNNPLLSVPASVTIPAGASSATFTVNASASITSNRIVTLTATFGGNSQTTTISLTNAVQTGYIGIFYFSTPPSPCPTALTILCAANTSVNNSLGGAQDGPVFVIVNTSSVPITNAVLTVVGVDSFNVGTVAANSSVTVVPGVTKDGQNHGSSNFFTVTGGIYDTSENFPSLNSTQFKFSGQQGSTQIQSVDICGIVAAPFFTPACTAGPSNDGTITTPPLNFLGGPGDNDGPCNNCFGPAIVASLSTVTSSNSGSPVTITTAPLPGVTTGLAYSQQLTVNGGTPPYTWALAGGSLPAGMGLASTGIISGTPARAGSYTVTVRATDATGASVVGLFSITVTAPAVTITTPSPLPSGMVTVDYPLQVISAAGGFAPYTFSVSPNSLPTGLTLSSNGSISGTPTVTGTFNLTLTATDVTGQTGSKAFQITVRPFSADLTTSAGSLSFSIPAGTIALPASQTVQVQSTDVTKPLSWSAAVTPAQPWLSVTKGGTTPGSFTVSLTSAASSLTASATPYQATITVACQAPGPCAGNSQTVAVSLLVSTVSPALTAITDVLSFSTSAASPQPSTQSLNVQNTGGGSIIFTSVTCPQTWCTAGPLPAPLGAGVTASINVTANPSGLSSGFYFTTLTIVSSAGTTAVPVTFFIAGNPSLALNPSGIQLTLPAGGVPAVPDTSFLVNVSGSAPVAWTATVLPGAPWLNLATNSGTSTGTTPGSISYSIDQNAAGALTPQAYYGTIRVTSVGVVNSPQDFQVILNVTAATLKAQPNPTPAGLLFLSTVGGAPQPKVDRVFASSSTPVAYQASTATADGNAWLSVSPATGTTSAASPAQTNISVSTTGLAVGVYQGSVSYSLSAAAVRTVNVTLVVEPAGGISTQGAGRLPSVSSSSTPQATCTPTQLIPTQTGLVSNFAAPASWPTQLEVQLVNDCGSSVTNGQIVTTFSNGDPPLVLSPENASSGLYTATWTPHTSGAQVTITATATVPGFPAATGRISGSVVPNLAPVLAPHGTLHVFTPAIGAPLAPGTIVQIYGTGLAAQTIPNTTIPLATTLGGTSVIVGGVQAPLFFVSAGQVNAQIPFELTPGQAYQVIVSNNGALTTPQTIQATAVTPGVASLASGYANAQHGSDSSLITDASPAKPGEYIVIYLAGMGATTVPVISGAGAPSSPLAQTSADPVITLNSEPVPFLFSGLTPGLAGLYQINLQVPADAPDGDLTLLVTQPGTQGSSVILPVHH